MKKLTSVNILGTKISLLDYNSAIKIIESNLKKRSSFVCVSAVHLLMESYNDKGFQKDINKSLITTADGMPLVWISNLVSHKTSSRVYGPELTLKLCELSNNKQYKIFLLGGSKGECREVKKKLINKYPALKIVGYVDTPVRPLSQKVNNLVVRKIKKLNPDIIFIGLGCPLQEKWMVENHKKFKHGVFIGVGAAFDFISGKVSQAPEWMQRIGLEWFYRLVQDPRRLWKRYLILNSQFIFEVLRKYNTFKTESF